MPIIKIIRRNVKDARLLCSLANEFLKHGTPCFKNIEVVLAI